METDRNKEANTLLTIAVILLIQTRGKLDFAFDLDREIEWKLRKADRAAAVSADVSSKEFKDEVGESIDDAGLLVEARR